MKTTIVPAQITTVEDKIAGNLSFTQILLLIGALFSATFVYVAFPTPLKLSPYKIPFMLLFASIFLLLAIRIRGKVIINWISIISAYAFRPQYYVFNKNDLANREVIIEEVVKKVKTHAKQKAKVEQSSEKASISDVVVMEQLLLNPNRNVRFALNGKGGINVTVSEGK